MPRPVHLVDDADAFGIAVFDNDADGVWVIGSTHKQPLSDRFSINSFCTNSINFK